MPSILITGGTGYIGSHACVELINAGYEVIVLDNLSNSKAETITRIEEITGRQPVFIEGDILNDADLESAFDRAPIAAVIHFAGLKAVGESNAIPLKYYKNNVVGTTKLLEHMTLRNVKQIVFSSSATVYGNPRQCPISEESELQTTNPYGRTKLIVEEILQDLCQSDPSWSCLALRYFNPVGAHPSAKIGEDPIGAPANLVPLVTQVAAGIRDEVCVFGNDYSTKDGTGIRDYIHVTDLANGHLKALEFIYKNRGFDAINLGTSRGYSVLEIIERLEKIADKKIAYRFAKRRSGDAAECWADAKRAMQFLGWRAQKSLNEMLKDAWRWQTANKSSDDRT